MDEIADEIGGTSSQVAIAWVRQQPGVIVPLLGARNPDQFQDDLCALDVSLGADHLARLDEVSKVEPGFPHDFMAMDNVRDLVYGGTYDQIDHRRRR